MIDFDLRDTLHAALEAGLADASAGAGALSVSLSPDVPVALTGDERALRRSLKLLLSHALRSGGAELTIYADGFEPDLSVLSFEVRDRAPRELRSAEVPDFGSLSASSDDADLVLWAHSTKLFAEELGVHADPEGGNLYWFRVGVVVRHPADARPLELQR